MNRGKRSSRTARWLPHLAGALLALVPVPLLAVDPTRATEPTRGEETSQEAAVPPSGQADTGKPPSASPDGLSPEILEKSIERAVAIVLAEADDPCAALHRAGKPCFHVTVEREGPTVSVARDFAKWVSPAQLREQAFFRTIDREGQSPTVGVGSDPVCAGKLLFRLAGGKNTTFYLYRVWDSRGERAVLQETERKPSSGPADPNGGFLLVRKLRGECEAIAAYGALNREIRERNLAKTPRPSIEQGPVPGVDWGETR